MSLARSWAVALVGVDGRMVEIEADVNRGRPQVQLVGLPDAALNEAKDRVRAAVRNSGIDWPDQQTPWPCRRRTCPRAVPDTT